MKDAQLPQRSQSSVLHLRLSPFIHRSAAAAGGSESADAFSQHVEEAFFTASTLCSIHLCLQVQRIIHSKVTEASRAHPALGRRQSQIFAVGSGGLVSVGALLRSSVQLCQFTGANAVFVRLSAVKHVATATPGGVAQWDKRDAAGKKKVAS